MIDSNPRKYQFHFQNAIVLVRFCFFLHQKFIQTNKRYSIPVVICIKFVNSHGNKSTVLFLIFQLVAFLYRIRILFRLYIPAILCAYSLTKSQKLPYTPFRFHRHHIQTHTNTHQAHIILSSL